MRISAGRIRMCGTNSSGVRFKSWEGTMKRFKLAISLMLAATPLFAQTSKASLAGLIETGNRKTALERIRTGSDINEAQPDGTRPIHWAVYRVDYELIGALIAKKANVNVRNEF